MTTPNLAMIDPTTIGVALGGVFGLLITAYGLYLSWKSSKVKEQMSELIKIGKEINDKLDRLLVDL